MVALAKGRQCLILKHQVGFSKLLEQAPLKTKSGRGKTQSTDDIIFWITLDQLIKFTNTYIFMTVWANVPFIHPRNLRKTILSLSHSFLERL